MAEKLVSRFKDICFICAPSQLVYNEYTDRTLLLGRWDGKAGRAHNAEVTNNKVANDWCSELTNIQLYTPNCIVMVISEFIDRYSVTKRTSLFTSADTFPILVNSKAIRFIPHTSVQFSETRRIEGRLKEQAVSPL